MDDPGKNAGDESAPAPVTPVAPEALEQQAPRPRPTLHALGQPSPMFSPLMFVPPTPRSQPGTPRAAPGTPRKPRTRSRSAPRLRGQDGSAAGSHQVPERDPPSEPALPGRRGQVPAELPEGTSFERLQSGVSDQTYIPGRDPASEPALPGGHNVSRRSSLGSQFGSSQHGALDRILENEYPELRGIKRPAESHPEAPGPRSVVNPASSSGAPQAPREVEPEPQVLISYCRDCGERCFPRSLLALYGIHPVRSPCDVLSWLDEVKEREAFDSLVGTSKRSSPTTTSTTMLTSWPLSSAR